MVQLPRWSIALIAGLGGILVATAVTAGAQVAGLHLNAGDSAHVDCAGPSLSVANQTATGLDLACAPQQVAPSGPAVSQDQVSTGFGPGAVTVDVADSAPHVAVAWVATDGPTSGGQTATVSGGGLTWTLAGRSNAQAGDAEVWWATTTGSGFSVTATPASGTLNTELTVVTYNGAIRVGAAGSASGTAGPPAVSLTAEASGSLVGAVGFDWDGSSPRVVPTDQTLDAQDTDISGDTFWVQHLVGGTTAGQQVTLNDTLPTVDRFNLEAVEVVAAPAPPVTTTTVPATTTTVPATTTTTVPATTTTTVPATTTTTAPSPPAGGSPAPAVDPSTPPIATVTNNVGATESPAFSPPAGTVLYAVFSMDSYPGSGATVAGVSNTGLPLVWTLKGTENHTDGTSIGGFVAVWWASNPVAQSNITVTGTFNVPSKNVVAPVGGLQVLVMDNAAANQSGASWTPTWDIGGGSVPKGSVLTSAADSLVLGVFDNWDSGVTPAVPANQTMTINGRPSIVLNAADRDTYWVQSQTAATPKAGTLVSMNDTSPSIRYHQITWEVLAG